MRFFKADSPRLAVVFVLMLAAIGANLLKPWPIAIIVDGFLGGKPLPAWLPFAESGAGQTAGGMLAAPLLVLIVAIFLLHALHGLISTGQNYLAIQVGLRGLRRARDAVFACLQRLSLRFHHGHKTGDLIYRASWDTYAFQTLFQQGLVTFSTSVVTLGLMLIVMSRINGQLTLVALLIMPLMVLAIRFFGRIMYARGAAAQKADSLVTSLVQQNITALPLIQSYTGEERAREAFMAQTAEAEEKRLSQHGWELLYWLGITVVFGLGVAVTVWVGSGQVLANRLTIGELWIFLAYLAQLYEPLNQLAHVGSTLSTAGAAAARVFELLDAPEEVKDAPDARPVVQTAPDAKPKETPPAGSLVVKGAIEFRNVSFGYEPDRPVLRGIGFQVGPGERVALIGPSGVGKSTLMNLLPRFFDPTEGAVRLDGEDLRKLKLKDLRAHVAVVLQEPILLPATIAANIAYGNPDAGRERIEAAARAANAHEFIQRLPLKYETVVDDGGVRLSVGERQRINIARAFLKDAPVLLLDEPTSALDADSEAAVVKGMFELMRGRTTLIIAHRLTTIRRVDRVLVLEEGHLAEDGAPDELLHRPGGYFARVAAGQIKLDE